MAVKGTTTAARVADFTRGEREKISSVLLAHIINDEAG